MKKLTFIFLFVSQICLSQWPISQLGPGGSWDFKGLTKPSKDSNRVYAIFYLQTQDEPNVRIYGKVPGQQSIFLLRSITVQQSNLQHSPIGPSLPTYGDERILTRSFDCNGDGYNELLDQSNNAIRIFDGISGTSIFIDECVSDHKKVKIVDMDNDGFAELIFTRPNGNVTVVAFTPAIVPISINSENVIVPDYNLKQNYPNPFNPSTTIEYDLKKKANVKLIISNVLGQQIKTFENEDQTIGTHKVTFDASDFPSGTYFYTIILDGILDSKKMLFIK